MKEKGKTFQTILIGICIGAIILSVLVFSGKIPLGNKADSSIVGNLVIWGTLPASQIRGMVSGVAKVHKKINVQYIYKDPRTYHNDVVEALASGTGPDLFFFSSGELYEHTPRLFEIPYSNYPDLVYRETFIDEAAHNLTTTGVLAFPFVVDPLVLYSNRDILSSSFISTPPATWDELVAMTPALTRQTESGTISQSALPFGTFNNIAHSKDIISMLFMQTGNPITKRVEDGIVRSVVEAPVGNEIPTGKALGFYTRFAKPGDDLYTWNPSLPLDTNQFLAGKAAFYIGYASEFKTLQTRNPNLPIGVSLVPQRASSTTKLTYGNVTSIGVSKVSQQRAAAVAFLLWFTSKDILKVFADAVDQVPARKDLLGDKPRDDGFKTLVYNSALISHSWIDPDADATAAIFSDTVNRLLGGAIPDPMSGILNIHTRLSALLDS